MNIEGGRFESTKVSPYPRSPLRSCKSRFRYNQSHHVDYGDNKVADTPQNRSSAHILPYDARVALKTETMCRNRRS